MKQIIEKLDKLYKDLDNLVNMACHSGDIGEIMEAEKNIMLTLADITQNHKWLIDQDIDINIQIIEQCFDEEYQNMKLECDVPMEYQIKNFYRQKILLMLIKSKNEIKKRLVNEIVGLLESKPNLTYADIINHIKES